ncbi:fumarylacetoacetate hydrolase family protein [Massilia sp. MS-15]|uniref:fumarylacetoacetate hydrolase family protein n=1 Tax=Massilia sp. MS-15 TaxID=2878200 RepID=UPI001CD76FC0|nr:fumarylacetoacetate hydrolase family protein [Massilia sp. MS-15]MCA1246144.1 fumarylacetoacetate hydrolase family protein [Massilia sp. MS-15]
MKICWYNQQQLGAVIDGRVFDVSAALEALPAARYPAAPGDLLVAHLDGVRAAIAALLPDAASIPVEEARFLSPVANPGKIIGVPVNYADHVAEANADQATFTDRYKGAVREQGLFLKAASALVGPSEGVALRFPQRLSHHEMELGVVIGKTVANVSVDDALSCVAGYAIALDMTVRGPEDRSLRKSVDSYAVLGPWMVTADEAGDAEQLDIELQVNGVLRQKANTAEMLIGLAEQIAWASSYYTLYPGDIIMSGTCAGVGQVLPGDVMDCAIDGIGAMRVAVRAAGE